MSVSTLKRWMRRHSEKFEEMGVTPSQRLLPPKVVRYICEELGIHEEDFKCLF